MGSTQILLVGCSCTFIVGASTAAVYGVQGSQGAGTPGKGDCRSPENEGAQFSGDFRPATYHVILGYIIKDNDEDTQISKCEHKIYAGRLGG